MTPQLRPTTQCDRCLDFQPLSPWPEGLPGIALDGWVIAGFSSELMLDYPWQEKQSEDFIQLFFSVHPHISFGELSEFFHRAHGLNPDQCRESGRALIQALPELLARYGYREESRFSSLSERLASTPTEFRAWLIERRMTPGDLLPLLSLKTENSADLTKGLCEIARRRMTRQDGSKALELAVELLLKGEKDLFVSDTRPWLEYLQKLRHPQTTQRDSQAHAWVTEQIWPRQSQIRWVRQGDQAGLEVRMVIRQPQDFQKSKDSLERIEKIFEQAPQNLWPKH